MTRTPSGIKIIKVRPLGYVVWEEGRNGSIGESTRTLYMWQDFKVKQVPATLPKKKIYAGLGQEDSFCRFILATNSYSSSRILSPWLGDIVDSGIRLSLSSCQELWILLQVILKTQRFIDRRFIKSLSFFNNWWETTLGKETLYKSNIKKIVYGHDDCTVLSEKSLLLSRKYCIFVHL